MWINSSVLNDEELSAINAPASTARLSENKASQSWSKCDKAEKFVEQKLIFEGDAK